MRRIISILAIFILFLPSFVSADVTLESDGSTTVTGDLDVQGNLTGPDIQKPLGGSCSVGSSIRAIYANGTIECETDSDSGGDITGVSNGTGLTGGGTSGDVTLNVDTTYIQRRVSSSCTAGSSIRVINEDGTVECESDDGNGDSHSLDAADGSPTNAVYVDNNGKVGVGTITPGSKLEVDGNITSTQQIVSTVSTGTSPLQVSSTTMVNNLNCEMIEGYSATSLINLIPTQIPRTNTLTTVDSAGSVGSSPSITIGTDGLPVISYNDYTNEDLKVAKCGNASCSSGNTITTVDSSGRVGWDNSITIGTDGLPVISYYDASNSDLKVAKCGNTSCSSGNTITTVDALLQTGYNTSITIGTDGLPVISYSGYDEMANGCLKVAKCGNASCSSGNTIAWVHCYSYGPYTSITIGTDGLPVISYFNYNSRDLLVAKCGNASCSSGNSIIAIDTVGDVGWYTSITIGTDGLPIIAYLDKTSNSDLKVAKCGNASCSSGNILTTVDSAVSVGNFPSITIGTDGLPVISYADITNEVLKVAKCGNTSCSSGNTITTVDALLQIGYNTSITIGTDGLPVISYSDASNEDLKVAKCANHFCLPNWTRR